MGVITENPDKWPGAYGGSGEECRAWLEKDAAIKRAALQAPLAKRAATGKAAAFDWPSDVTSLRKALDSIDHANRETYLMKMLAGSPLPADVIIEAQKQFYGDQIEWLMRENSELEETLRSERATRDRVEKEIIDALADQIFDFTKALVLRETQHRVAALRTRVLAKAGQVKNEGGAIEKLNARAVLLEGRVRHLELVNPIWVSADTGG
jgi:hypothetical protein